MYKYVILIGIIISIIILYYKYKPTKTNDSISSLDDYINKKLLIGNVGEYRVAFKLNKLITSEIGTVINNVMLQSKNFSTQIDHIVIGNNNKIIIIETKNYKGTISGNIKDRFWTQEINGHVYKFSNPVLQNNYHKNSIEQLFNWYNIKYYKIIHIVVFSDNSCELNINSDFVVKLKDLDEVLYKFLKPCKNNSKDIVDLINRKNMSGSLVAREKHNKYIRAKLQKA